MSLCPLRNPSYVSICLLFLGGLCTFRVDAEATKPLPAVVLEWSAAGDPVRGADLEAVLRLTTHVPVLRVELGFTPDAERLLVEPPPRLDGRPQPGVLEFPVRVRVPRNGAAGVTATARVTSAAGSYTVGAQLDLRPMHERGSRGRLVQAAGEPRWEYVARGVAPQAVGPVATPKGSAIAPAVALTGRLLYEDREQDPDGFVHSDPAQNPLAPIRFADLELLLNDVVIDTGFTDSTGAFAFATTGPGEYQVRALSTSQRWGNSQVRVYVSQGTPAPFSVVSDPVTSPAVDTDFGDLVAIAEGGGEAFNILDNTLEGAHFVRELTGSFPNVLLTVYWNATSTSGTFYSRSQSAVYLLADDAYDDSVVLHEYGHYVMWNYSTDQSLGGAHFVDDSNQDVRLSWSEGFASYFQSATRLRRGDPFPSWYVDTTGGAGQGQLFFSYDAEGPSFNVTGSGSEVAVQAMLWEIGDGPTTPGDPAPGVDDDGLELAPGEIFEVLTGPLTSASTLSVEDFWDGWFSPSVNNGFVAEMEAAFGPLGAEFFPDAWETGDTPGTAAPIALDGSPVHRTFYPAGDTDYHRLDLLAGETVTVETLNILGYGDTRLEILDPALTVIADNDDKGGGLIASLVTFSAPTDGAYHVRVLRSFADVRSQYTQYGSYDLRALRGAPNMPLFTLLPLSNGTGDAGFGLGAAFADYNGDGLPDLVVINNGAGGATAGADALFLNQGNLSFTNITGSAGLGNPEGGVAAAWGDYDNDGDLDLFASDHALYRNNGDGTFTDATTTSEILDLGREFDAAWADADNDGLLDLFVAVRDAPSALWHNNGDGTFTNVTSTAGFGFPVDGGDAASCAWGDYDNDFLPDLFVGFRSAPGHALYHNLGNNQFADVTTTAGVSATDEANGAMWGDIDDDGWLDLFVSSPGGNKLYINLGAGAFAERAALWGVDDGGVNESSAFSDMDLDGDLDLYVADLLGANSLYENLGGAMVGLAAAGDGGLGLGCAWADVDGDGDEDLYVARGCSPCETNLLYKNETVESLSPGWLQLTVVGTMSPRDGSGARVRLFTEDGVQHRTVGTGTGWASRSRVPERFGFRADARLDSLEVVWPSGFRLVAPAPDPGAHLRMSEDGTVPVLPPGDLPGNRVTLSPAFPNPFTAATTLGIVLEQPALVTVEVYDGSGRRVRRLLHRSLEAGSHIAGWDGADDAGRSLPAGIYFYRLRAGEIVQTVKLVRVATGR